MKRLIIVLSCLSVLYAGAVWALEGCRDFGVKADVDHTGAGSASHRHDAGAPSHHSHSDPSKVHCPNVFGEFLISARESLTSDSGGHYHPAVVRDSVKDFLSDTISGGFGAGPPGSPHSKTLPRHLLLSVIRI